MSQVLRLERLTLACLARRPALEGATLKIYRMEQCLQQMRLMLQILKAKDRLYRLLVLPQKAALEALLRDFQLECQLHFRLNLATS